MDERLKMSWRMGISTCQEGTQTNVTLAARIRSLEEQVVLRNLGFKDRGEPEIELSMLIVADNHITRHGAEVQAAMLIQSEIENSTNDMIPARQGFLMPKGTRS
jgi:hypothetical protein